MSAEPTFQVWKQQMIDHILNHNRQEGFEPDKSTRAAQEERLALIEEKFALLVKIDASNVFVFHEERWDRLREIDLQIYRDSYPEGFHRGGVPWSRAPLPPREHECQVHSYQWYGPFHVRDRCVCGASRPDRMYGAWYEVNSRRGDEPQAEEQRKRLWQRLFGGSR